jgi:hypothetical protein
MVERLAAAARRKFEQFQREGKISPQLDPVESEFQAALGASIQRRDDLPQSSALTDALGDWTQIAVELYDLDDVSELPDDGWLPYDQLSLRTEREVVEAVVDAWAAVAGVDLNGHPELERQLHEFVADAYAEAFDEFVHQIKGTDLVDVVALETLDDVQRRIDGLVAEYQRPKVYKTLAEFERQLFSRQQASVPVAAEREESSLLERASTEVADAKAAVLEALADGTDIVTVYGQGGAGKSQLLASVGEALVDRGDVAVRYVTSPEEHRPPPPDRDTVLFVDDAGRKEMDYFLRRAVDTERTASNQRHDVQVVAAARPQYEQSVDEVLTEYPGLKRVTFRLQPLDEASLRALVEPFDLTDDAVDGLVTTAQGNPFFAVVLAQLVDQEGTPDEGMRAALDQVVGRMVRTDVEATDGTSRDVRRLLTALSIWETYDDPGDADLVEPVAPSIAGRIPRREQLRELVQHGYLDRQSHPETTAETYTIRYDVVADYLRFEALDEGRYRAIAREALDTKAPAVADGLLDLHRSPLVPFYPRVAAQDVRDQVDWLGDVVFRDDIPLVVAFETKIHLALSYPDHARDDRLAALFDRLETPEDVVGLVALLLGVLWEFVGDEAEDEPETGWLQTAVAWTDRLRSVHAETGHGSVPLALSLRNAVVNLGDPETFAPMEVRVDQLERLHEDQPVESTRWQLAAGLAAAAISFGRAALVPAMDTRLDQLTRLYEDYPEQPIRLQFGRAVVEITRTLGDAGRFGVMDDRLDQLAQLHDDYPDQYLRELLADALLNAVTKLSEGEAPDAMAARADQLRALHEAYPEPAVRERLATALYNTVTDHSIAGRPEQLTDRLDQLTQLHENYPEPAVREQLATALYNGIERANDGTALDDARTQLDQLTGLYETYPEPPVREQLARALPNVVMGLALTGRFDEMTVRAAQLDRLAAESGGDEVVHEQLGMALNNVVSGYQQAGEPAAIEPWLDRLAVLHETHPTETIREYLAGCLAATVGAHAAVGALDQLNARLAQLRDLYNECPEPAVREAYAKGLHNAVAELSKRERFDPMATRLDQLRELHAAHPEDAIRPLLARALRNAASLRARTADHEAFETRLDQLTALHDDHPDPRVREQLVATLLNAADIYAVASTPDRVADHLDHLDDLVTTHEDVGLGHDIDPTKSRTVLESLLASLLAVDEALAVRALRVGRACLDDREWDRFYNDIILPLDQRVADGDLSVETYRAIVNLG